jgi:hypothetical protein
MYIRVFFPHRQTVVRLLLLTGSSSTPTSSIYLWLMTLPELWNRLYAVHSFRITCQSLWPSFRHLNRTDFKRKDLIAFEDCFQDRIPGNLTVFENMTLDKYVCWGADQIHPEGLALSAPKCRPVVTRILYCPLVFMTKYAKEAKGRQQNL